MHNTYAYVDARCLCASCEEPSIEDRLILTYVYLDVYQKDHKSAALMNTVSI